MVIVKEWATILRPQGRFSALFLLLSLVVVEAAAIGGALVSIAERRELTEIVFWISLGTLYFFALLAIMIRKNHSLRVGAMAILEDRTQDKVFLFSSSALASGINRWQDWKNDHTRGAGFLILKDRTVQIWAPASSLIAEYSLNDIVKMEDVRLWAKWAWSPQLRITFSDGYQFMAALTRAGLRGYVGFGESGMRKLAQEFETRAPGLTKR